MQKQTKTQTRKTAKSINKKSTRTARKSRRCLGECSTQSWMSSSNTRPKTVFLTLTRTQAGYTVQEAAILNRVNQFSAVPVQLDVRAVVADINGRGLTA